MNFVFRWFWDNKSHPLVLEYQITKHGHCTVWNPYLITCPSLFTIRFNLVSFFVVAWRHAFFSWHLFKNESPASFDLFSVSSCPVSLAQMVCVVSSSDESALQLQGSRAVNVLQTPLPPVSGATVCAMNNTKLPRPLPGHLGPSRDKDL